ncbi:MAG TPA: hypothetical protein VEJ84_15235 [Acidimicrobiales bacterium]|nr:hypothetical protein [Acidimicrobiales bacterium]
MNESRLQRSLRVRCGAVGVPGVAVALPFSPAGGDALACSVATTSMGRGGAADLVRVSAGEVLGVEANRTGSENLELNMIYKLDRQ